MDQDAAMILLNCLSYSYDADKEAVLSSVTAEEWRKVVDLAHLHKVAPLLYHYLRRLKSTLPGELFYELEQAHVQNTFRNMRLYQELHKLLPIFRPLSNRVWREGSQNVQDLPLNRAQFWVMNLVMAIRVSRDDDGIILKGFEQFLGGWIKIVMTFWHQTFDHFLILGNILANVVLNESCN